MEKFRRVTNMAAISVLMRDENDTVKKNNGKNPTKYIFSCNQCSKKYIKII
jgi:hypothetical protein